MTYCTNCGKLQEPAARFCTGCGRQGRGASSDAVQKALPESLSGPNSPEDFPPLQDTDDGSATGAPAHRSRGRFVITLAGLVVVLGAGGIAWATLIHGTDPPVPSRLAPPPARAETGSPPTRSTEPSPTLSPTEAARQQLTRQTALDRPQVQSGLAEAWTAQLSSKRPGLVVDGRTYGYTEILNDHLALRSAHGARLVWSGDWSSFGAGDFYVTLAPVPFSTAAEANAWCDLQAIDADNCFAKRLSTVVGPEGSTVNR